MARAVRVLIYEGTPSFVTNSLTKAHVPINGTYSVSMENKITSTIAAVHTGCVLCGTLTNNKTLICDDCLIKANNIVRQSEIKDDNQK